VVVEVVRCTVEGAVVLGREQPEGGVGVGVAVEQPGDVAVDAAVKDKWAVALLTRVEA